MLRFKNSGYLVLQDNDPKRHESNEEIVIPPTVYLRRVNTNNYPEMMELNLCTNCSKIPFTPEGHIVREQFLEDSDWFMTYNRGKVFNLW